ACAGCAGSSRPAGTPVRAASCRTCWGWTSNSPSIVTERSSSAPSAARSGRRASPASTTNRPTCRAPQRSTNPGSGSIASMVDHTPPRRRPTLDPASAAVRRAVRDCLAAAPESPGGAAGGANDTSGANAVNGANDTSGAPDFAVPGLIVAVSGGADSMALLHACAFLHRRGEIRAKAVTVDHGLQAETAEVAHRVAATADSWGMPAEVVPVDISETDEGLEAAARNARYTALEAARTRAGADWILTAHTRSDQAETVLLGLMRGSGTRSLAGMSMRTGRLLRPLLGLDRE